MTALNKRNPSLGGLGFNKSNADIQLSGLTPLEIIITRLEGVRKSGRGFIAKCPAHGDKTASLAISEAQNGNALIHCFAGCCGLDVMQAIGLNLADLYQRRVTQSMTPQERTERRLAAKQAGWGAALNVLNLEANIVLIGAAETIKGQELNFDDLMRLDLAVKRIGDAKAVLNAR